MADNRATPGLHPLLASRWSPTTFDTAHELTATEVDLLLEAARCSTATSAPDMAKAASPQGSSRQGVRSG